MSGAARSAAAVVDGAVVHAEPVSDAAGAVGVVERAVVGQAPEVADQGEQFRPAVAWGFVGWIVVVTVASRQAVEGPADVASVWPIPLVKRVPITRRITHLWSRGRETARTALGCLISSSSRAAGRASCARRSGAAMERAGTSCPFTSAGHEPIGLCLVGRGLAHDPGSSEPGAGWQADVVPKGVGCRAQPSPRPALEVGHRP